MSTFMKLGLRAVSGIALFTVPMFAHAQSISDYKICLTAGYAFAGSIPGEATAIGGQASPDSGYVVFTNMGTSTFNGSIGATGIDAFNNAPHSPSGRSNISRQGKLPI